MIRIIGIGSPLGDDEAGLAAARQLAGTLRPDVEVVAVERPGVALLDLFDGADAVILIDACRSNAAPGTLHDLSLPVVLHQPARPLSSHALGITEALQLAEQLDRMPSRGRLLGIEVESDWPPPHEPLSPAAAIGVEAAVARAQSWVRRFSVSPAGCALRTSARRTD